MTVQEDQVLGVGIANVAATDDDLSPHGLQTLEFKGIDNHHAKEDVLIKPNMFFYVFKL